MKIRSVGAELFHADRRTDGQRGMKKLKVAFRNFTKAPKKMPVYTQSQIGLHTYTRAHARSAIFVIGIFNFRDKTLYKSFKLFVSRSDESGLTFRHRAS